MPSRALAVISILTLTIACGDSQRVTGPSQAAARPVPESPQPTVDHSIMKPASPMSLMVFPGGPELAPPAVRILLSRANTPVSGVRVTFAFSNGTRSSAVTDRDGYARTDNWDLDFSRSAESVVATADDVSNSIQFTATILRKTPMAIYELQTIAGKELPLTYQGGGQTWDITSGRYVLFDDGTYIFGYEVDGKQGWGRMLQFIRHDSSIEFYLSQETAPASQFYADRGYLFSTGALNGGTMVMKYEDFIDFDEEVYRLRQ